MVCYRRAADTLKWITDNSCCLRFNHNVLAIENLSDEPFYDWIIRTRLLCHLSVIK